PHVYALDGRYLVRDKTASGPLSARRLRKLLLERGEISYESAVPEGGALADLDWRKVEDYLRLLPGLSGETPQDVLLARGCLRPEGGEPRPTVAGLLLFGRRPQRWAPGADVQAARFSGREMSDQFVREAIPGTLPEQLQRASAFLAENVRRVARLTGLTREEQPDLPLEAVREVVVNAVAHRDYAIRGDNIRVLLFSDRLEVFSPGRLPGPVTVANIAEARFSRNAAIVQVLADMGYIERLGYGVDRLLALMRRAGLRRPNFEELAGGFRVTLYGPGEAAGDAAAADLSRWQGLNLSARQERALQYLLGHRRITNREYQDLCPEVHAETIRRDLADLVDRGVLLKIGDKRATYYILKD
ncbi:MAG: transcriptional regulator, partial [Chloroflexi bacterium]|nr:transcriptional regulator [Chloroflexota bacterium]